jgi:protein gp37
MGENSKIAWTDNTFNPWIGCQKVSAGCQNCYAEALAKRYGWVNEWGKDYRLTSDANWKKPIQWAKQAVKDGVIRRVFCASLADVFDANIPNIWWRQDLWKMIDETGKIGGLEWLLLTKRPERISGMIPGLWIQNEPSNVRIGITCENAEMARLRMPVFLEAWKGPNFISWEPALSPITDWIPFLKNWHMDWIIAGCESGPNARPCNIEWVRDLRDQCEQSGTPLFLKQLVIDGKLTVEPELDGEKYLEFPKAD